MYSINLLLNQKKHNLQNCSQNQTINTHISHPNFSSPVHAVISIRPALKTRHDSCWYFGVAWSPSVLFRTNAPHSHTIFAIIHFPFSFWSSSVCSLGAPPSVPVWTATWAIPLFSGIFLAVWIQQMIHWLHDWWLLTWIAGKTISGNSNSKHVKLFRQLYTCLTQNPTNYLLHADFVKSA